MLLPGLVDLVERFLAYVLYLKPSEHWVIFEVNIKAQNKNFNTFHFFCVLENFFCLESLQSKYTITQKKSVVAEEFSQQFGSTCI